MMSDYKETLNLPKTDFAMQAQLSVREPQQIADWEKISLYQKIRASRKGEPKYILHDGPPYANGHLHLGHAVNKILKDIVCKAKTLSGFDAPFVPGWDCHGLPIELNVEKKLGKAGLKISHKEFRQKCREYAREQIDVQRTEFKRLGGIGDWENPYVTMDHRYEANIIRSVGRFLEKGYLAQGFKPVHWCMDCRSALAEAEVEYEDKASLALDVQFPLIDPALLLKRLNYNPEAMGEGRVAVPIWTTTPWTLPANQAVAVHPKLKYVLVQCTTSSGSSYLLLAEALVQEVMERLGIREHCVVASGLGAVLEGLLLQHPFYERSVPIILGDHVTMDQGTGCVHTAPAHGPEDYKMGVHYHLEIDTPVLPNGCYAPEIPIFAGEHVTKVENHIVEVLTQKGNLLKAQSMTHSYPHCWRHKTPVIFRATAQWFIKIDHEDLRQHTLKAIEGIKWFPSWGQTRLNAMIEGRPDWCISRQRSWGAPITLFVHKETHLLHPRMNEYIEAIAQRVEQNGIDAWFELAPEELLGSEAASYEKTMDILDVWFESGVSYACVLQERPELQFPADLYLEGSDQHRGWFNSSLITAMATEGIPPYKAVLTHGFTVDAQGKKMSKSLGNYVTPEELIKKSGADLLRLWVAATDYRAELACSAEIMTRMSDAYRRMRNTARFLLANLFDFDPKTHLVPGSQLLALDLWAIDCARSLQEEIIVAYETFNFHVIYQKIHNFCIGALGGFYLDIIKDRQYTTQKESLARRSCQTALYHIGSALVRWLAPILSFTAEEIWKFMPGDKEVSVFLSRWYEGFPVCDAAPFSNEAWQKVIAIRDEVNKALEVKRARGEIGSGLGSQVILYCESSYKDLLLRFGEELRFIFITSGVALKDLSEKPPALDATELPGFYVEVFPSPDPKCVRCWHRRPDLGGDPIHPEICGRCVENIEGKGEIRLYA